MDRNFDIVIDRRVIQNINKWKWYPEDVLPMWIADMDFQSPAPVREALRQAIDHGIFGYERAEDSLPRFGSGVLLTERTGSAY